ncbi:MAG: hypothetical protein LBT74_12665 [Acidobacteriota bacterium]|jgi:flagellar assembly protein FliH|nr:hypothetical protein [Acidobacteriota bacterium]
MSLRIIKKGTAKTAEVQPFFFAEDDAFDAPRAAVWPEATLADEFPPVPEPVKAPAEEAHAPAAAEPEPDSARLEQEAFDRGVAEGRKGAEDAARRQMEEMSGRYADTLAELAELKKALRAQVEEEVVRLAVAVAKKIVQREVGIDPTIIQALVRVALDRASGKSSVTVRLNPEDYKYMLAKHDELAQVEGREITFAPDGGITRGGCLVQTESGDIDARIEEEFREVEEAFFKGSK